MQEQLIAFLDTQATRPLTAAELVAALNVPPARRGELQAALAQAMASGHVVRTATDRYAAPGRLGLVVGHIQAHPDGYAFLAPIRPAPASPEVVIGLEALHGALHGDLAVVRVLPPTRPHLLASGEVVHILRRSVDKLIGLFTGGKDGGFVRPDDGRIPLDVIIPRGQAGGARTGDKVLVRISAWPDGRRPPVGRVAARLGAAGDPAAEDRGLMAVLGLPAEFSRKALREAGELPAVISAAEAGRRADRRDQTLVVLRQRETDPAEVAVGVRRLARGRWRLLLCVADVGHHVPLDTALDREARRRGIAVDLAAGRLPLWPDPVAQGAAGLRPGQDGLALACELELQAGGSVVRHEIYPALVRPAALYTFAQAAALVAAGNGEGAAGTGDGDPEGQPAGRVKRALKQMQALAGILRRLRRKRGSLDLLDHWPGDGPDEAAVAAMALALAELEVAAGEAVAAHCAQAGVPLLYRAQDPPDTSALAALADFLALLGLPGLPAADPNPRRLRDLLARVSGRPVAVLVRGALLRALPPARYDAQPASHFSLNCGAYCRFTAPLRRYADLTVQRVLTDIWAHQGKLPPRRRRLWARQVAALAPELSQREQQAAGAEQAARQLLALLAWRDRVGDEVTGLVASVAPDGLGLWLPGQLAGRLPVDGLTDDFYRYDAGAHALVGAVTGQRFQLGDAVSVRLTAVDPAQGRLDFRLSPGPRPARDAGA